MVDNNNKFIREISLNIENLVVGISNRVLHVAESLEANGVVRDMSNAKDILDDTDVSLLRDMVHGRVVTAMNLLRPYTKTPLRAFPLYPASIMSVEKYVIVLHFDHTRSETDIINLEKAIFDYVVYGCVAEWLEMSGVPDGVCRSWGEKALSAREVVLSALVLPYEPQQTKVKPRWM